MELKHYINNREIDEPVGFDSLKMVMKRGEYHGMSAEVSEQTLEFYGRAADMIHDAYNTDIDTELRYIVMADETELYNGVIDLSTYEEQRSQYYSVSCKVGEVGVKTTFNNRADTEVDLNTEKTIDGEKLVGYSGIWRSLTIPQKHIGYVNTLSSKTDCIVIDSTNTDGKTRLIGARFTNFIPLFPCLLEANEYGTIGDITRVVSGTIENNQNYKDIVYTDNPDIAIWKKDEDFSEKFGEVHNQEIDINLSISLKFASHFFSYKNEQGEIVLIPLETNDWKMRCSIVIVENNTIIESGNVVEFFDNGEALTDVGVTKTITLQCKRAIYTDNLIFIGLRFEHINAGSQPVIGLIYPINTNAQFETIIKSGSYIKMKMYDNLQTLTPPVQMLMVGDALRKIALCCSENALVLRSDWYNSTLLPVGSAPKEYGGAAKAITNGYKIRGLFADSEHERPMTTSFKEMIESLDAMDCIGWGIVEEDGNLYLRVERWDWFYKSNKILSASAPNEIKRIVDESRIVTELNIGYKKYATADAYNSIDSVHGERTFVSPIKAVQSSIKRLSAFIADNYAIEETRRAQFQVDASEEFKYDENIFVFELAKTISGTPGAYSIRSAAEDVSGIDRPAEFINAKLSPRRCAARWEDYLFAANGAKAMKFSTGKLNTSAQYSTNNNTSLWSVTTDSTAENAEIESTHCIFKAETLSFKYPLTIEQYKAIKANPYGLIEVDGIQGWIKEFTYTFNTGEAEFKLIPKA